MKLFSLSLKTAFLFKEEIKKEKI